MRDKRIWRLRKPDYAVAEGLVREMAISRAMACILFNRKLISGQEVKLFLSASKTDLHDPLEIPGIKEGADRIFEAVKKQEKIVVFGDYDVDGITATALLTGLLHQLGGKVSYYIPDRLKEGYGLNRQALQRAKDDGAGLIVTVDCGIASCEEAVFAGELGLDLVISDHHQLPAVLPRALVVINPKKAAGIHPWSELSGVGVAYKLGQAIATLAGHEGLCDGYLDLVALGTVADIVPLLAENRILVREGLTLINSGTRPGIAAMLEIGGLTGKEISAQQIAYTVAPRLNACGRMSQAGIGVELLLTDSTAMAAEMAAMTQQENLTRQAFEAKMLDEALTKAEKELDLAHDKVIVLASPGWHPGVIGIVASRFVDKYYRPTVIIAVDNGVGKGSGRSIPGFNLYEALEHVREYLLEFGGHEMAAGLSVQEDKIIDLRKALNAYAADMLDEKCLIPVLNIDAEVSPGEITEQVIVEIDRLAPFGAENSSPLLVMRGLQLSSCKQVGGDRKHLKIRVMAEGNRLDGIAFNMGELQEQVVKWSKCDIVFSPEMNYFNGKAQPQLNIKDIKASGEPDDPYAGASFLDKLYAEGEVWLEDDYYRDIINREEFFTKVVGVSFEERQVTIRGIKDGETIRIKREPENEYDANALAVYYNSKCIGFLNARLARNLVFAFDKGALYEAYVTQITGRDQEMAGVNLCIRKVSKEKDASELETIKKSLNLLSEHELGEKIRKVILGNYSYHEKQNEALESLKAGHNTLVIFATGRGKSAVFQTMAAYLALVKKQITLIVYPLRSLVNDQYQRMRQKMIELGLQAACINGSASPEQKTEFFRNMLQGNVDIILTTPEFLEYHVEKFSAIAGRMGLLVIDEAHHLGKAKRKGYRALPGNWRRLGRPLALAVTATADEEFADKIINSLECSRVIIEDYERSNLCIVDAREEKDKLAYLVRLIAGNERAVIYVNSRKQAYQLASELRAYYPPAREEIGFYHGGLNSEYRHSLEEMFRERALRVMVTTSAFGEGIDIPDIKHVVLYHLCFSRTEFNQLAGRAGRDNKAASIHILFGDKDRKLNEFILDCAAPSREALAKLYVFLREQALLKNPFQLTNHQISEAMGQKGLKNFHEQTVSAGLAIFEELGLILREIEGGSRYIHFAPPPIGKLELTDSIRYLEGLGEWEEYQEFAAYVLSEEQTNILKAVNKPIYPVSMLEKKDRIV